MEFWRNIWKDITGKTSRELHQLCEEIHESHLQQEFLRKRLAEQARRLKIKQIKRVKFFGKI